MRGRKPKPRPNPFEKFRLERDPSAIAKKGGTMINSSENAVQNPDETACMEKDATLDSYSEHLEKTLEGQLLEKTLEIEELNVHLSAAKNENLQLKETLEKLMMETSDLKSSLEKVRSESIEPYEIRISELEAKNRELLATLNRMASELKAKEKIIVDKQAQLDTIKHSYTRTGYKNIPMKNSGFVQSMNGYQDWN